MNFNYANSISAFKKIIVLAIIYTQIHAEEFKIFTNKSEISKFRPCSRGYVKKIDGYWTPSKVQVEFALYDINKKIDGSYATDKGNILAITSAYQVFGLISNGDSLIYFNAMPAGSPAKTMKHLSNICDGGPMYWGALYDNESGTVLKINANGY